MTRTRAPPRRKVAGLQVEARHRGLQLEVKETVAPLLLEPLRLEAVAPRLEARRRCPVLRSAVLGNLLRRRQGPRLKLGGSARLLAVVLAPVASRSRCLQGRLEAVGATHRRVEVLRLRARIGEMAVVVPSPRKQHRPSEDPAAALPAQHRHRRLVHPLQKLLLAPGVLPARLLEEILQVQARTTTKAV